jgi:DNA repair protein SbcC/Rad50
MIPLKLTLKNFLSYRQAILDFRGLHTACICGANGAGKSSLLEAITWVIWGKSRALSDDDLIHAGAKMVRVDFDFISNGQVYRIIRNRSRGKSITLDFQVKTETSENFISLTGKGVKDTQKEIISALKLDYDTFVNSAYLRQGRADEFMLRKPNERKQILADLLKLDQYEELANQAKDLSRQLKGSVEQLSSSLAPMEEQLERRLNFENDKISLTKEIKVLQKSQETDQEKLLYLQKIEHERQNWEQQVNIQNGQYEKSKEYIRELYQDIATIQERLEKLDKLLEKEEEIKLEFDNFSQWQKKEEKLSNQFHEYQNLQKEKHQLEKQLLQQENELNLQIRQAQTHLDNVEKQEKEILVILNKKDEINVNFEKLTDYRHKLDHLDKIHGEVSPLLQQRQNLIMEIKQLESKLNLKLDHLKCDSQKLSKQMEKVPENRQLFFTLEEELEQLKNKRNYIQRVEQKGYDKNLLKDKLSADQKNCEKQLNELHQKLILLQTPDVLCPLCEQELDEHYRHKVIDKTKNHHQEIQEQFWLIQEQLRVCERDLISLREEYTKINQQLANYDPLQQKLAQLEAQLEATEDIYDQLQKIEEEITELEKSLTMETYGNDLKLELKELEKQIEELDYHEQTHALIREEEKRWRWVEFQYQKIKDANRNLEKINQEKPILLEKISYLKNQLDELHKTSELYQNIREINLRIKELHYDVEEHNKIRQLLRQGHSIQLRHQELKLGKEKYPQLQNNLHQRQEKLENCLKEQGEIRENLDNLKNKMDSFVDNRKEIKELEFIIQDRRQMLNNLFSKQGSVDQSLIQLNNLREQYQQTEKQLKEINQKYRIYQELAIAFGKNGIQALMIENILPHLEAETNYILSRLTGNQLHVQFLTQKATKSSQSKNKETKFIDTLEIIIADANGTRSYETYSGGEAFRINFAIRLALAKLLAQRAGTALQLLIIDEGFGTQDGDGCDKLIAAINGISADFACILAVTHLRQFKEAFETRIEISKTEEGSQIFVLQ